MKNNTHNLSFEEIIFGFILLLGLTGLFGPPIYNFVQENFPELNILNESYHEVRAQEEMEGFLELHPALHDFIKNGGPITTAHRDEWLGFQTTLIDLLHDMYPDMIIDKKWNTNDPIVVKMELDDYLFYPDHGDYNGWKDYFRKAKADIDEILPELDHAYILEQKTVLKAQYSADAIKVFFATHIGVNPYNIDELGLALTNLASTLTLYDDLLRDRHEKKHHMYREN